MRILPQGNGRKKQRGSHRRCPEETGTLKMQIAGWFHNRAEDRRTRTPGRRQRHPYFSWGRCSWRLLPGCATPDPVCWRIADGFLRKQSIPGVDPRNCRIFGNNPPGAEFFRARPFNQDGPYLFGPLSSSHITSGKKGSCPVNAPPVLLQNASFHSRISTLNCKKIQPFCRIFLHFSFCVQGLSTTS
jgi:hypothetical protein